MARRLELHALLKTICDNVYFQAPESLKMVYPAIRYEVYNIRNIHADNIVYQQMTAYRVTVIDRNPDSMIADAVSKLQYCAFNQFYASEGLNHFVFTLYY